MTSTTTSPRYTVESRENTAGRKGFAVIDSGGDFPGSAISWHRLESAATKNADATNARVA